jgi:hypothetical protein
MKEPDEESVAKSKRRTEPGGTTLANGWQVGEPVNPGAPLNSEVQNTSPALSADSRILLFESDREQHGRWLFFASDRRGGLGGEDIWVAPLRQPGK